MSGLAPVGDCPPNEYKDERFIVKASRPITYAVNGTAQGMTIFLFDRRRSMQLRTSPGDVLFAEKTKLGTRIPFHAEGHRKLVELMMDHGVQGQVLFVWARRIGDCLEIECVLHSTPSVPILMIAHIAWKTYRIKTSIFDSG